jgi:hypothetical protein
MLYDSGKRLHCAPSSDPPKDDEETRVQFGVTEALGGERQGAMIFSRSLSGLRLVSHHLFLRARFGPRCQCGVHGYEFDFGAATVALICM